MDHGSRIDCLLFALILTHAILITEGALTLVLVDATAVALKLRGLQRKGLARGEDLHRIDRMSREGALDHLLRLGLRGGLCRLILDYGLGGSVETRII